jgi:hypothetical protein
MRKPALQPSLSDRIALVGGWVVRVLPVSTPADDGATSA